MNEIGSIPVRVTFELARRHGVSVDTLIAGLDLSPDVVSAEEPDLSWNQFARVMGRLADALGGDVQMQALGEELADAAPDIVAMARPFVSPARLARFMFLVANPTIQPAVRATLESLPDGRLQLSTTLLDGYEDCAAFFHACAGALRTIPTWIDAPRAEVEAEIGPRGGVYRVRLPQVTESRAPQGQEAEFWTQAIAHLEADKARLTEALDALRRTNQVLELRNAELKREISHRQKVEGALRTVLEGMSASAFLVDPQGVKAANEAARAAMARQDGQLTGAIQQAVHQPPTVGGMQVAPLKEDGHFVVVRCTVEDEIEDRLRRAENRWGLTSRQIEVLRRLVDGQGNKEIARDLDCSVKTVEAHVTALLDRADADSRLSVVAAFWADL